MNSDYTVIVCTHKPDQYLRYDAPYLPVLGGSALRNDAGSVLSCPHRLDNDGENISNRNPRYSEMSSIYWAWKNLKDSKYIGITHYRRYFDINISKESVNILLSKYDVILPRPVLLHHTVAEELYKWIPQEDLFITLDVVLKQHPDYLQAIKDYVLRGTIWQPFNMQLTHWTSFDDYCSWIFPILFEAESIIKESPYTRAKRNMGYLSEVLTGLYFHYQLINNSIRIKYVDVIMPPGKYRSNNVWRILKSLKSNAFTVFHSIIKYLWFGQKFLNKDYLPIEGLGSVLVGLEKDGIILPNIKKSLTKG